MAQAMNELGEAGEAMGTFLLPVISSVAGFLKDMATGFQELDPQIQQFILVAAGIAAVLGPVLLIFSALLPAIGAVGVVIAALATPIGVIVLAVAAFALWVATHWDRIKEQTGMLVDAVKGFFEAIGQAFEDVGTWIGEVWDTITGVFEDAVDAISDVGKKLWAPIEDGFSAAIDGVKGIWNAFARFWNSIQITVPSVDIPLVGKVGGFTIGLPDLPQLAEGGIVSAPTLAIIGERGPEAVVPLSKGFGTTETHIHLTYAGEPPEEPRDLVALLLQVAPFVDGRLRVVD
jgi:phage-related protein